jgi:hypothetical protein
MTDRAADDRVGNTTTNHQWRASAEALVAAATAAAMAEAMAMVAVKVMRTSDNDDNDDDDATKQRRDDAMMPTMPTMTLTGRGGGGRTA